MAAVGAQVQGHLAAALRRLDHDHLLGAHRTRDLDRQQADVARADDRHALAGSQPAAAGGTHGDRGRLGQRRVRVAQAVRVLEAHVARRVDVLGQSAVGHQPHDGQPLAQVHLVPQAEGALAAVDQRVDGDPVADLQVGDVAARAGPPCRRIRGR